MPLWKQVPDWPKYEVSDDGQVRRKGKIVKPRRRRDRYWIVTLSDEPNGRRFTPSVHKLVALAFIGDQPSPIHQVDHRNGDKSDNRASNLRWVTPRQNRRRNQVASGSRNGASVLTEEQVADLRLAYDGGIETVESIARRFGISRQTVTKIGRRLGWTHI